MGVYIKLVNGDYKGGFNNLEKYESQIGSSQLLGGKKCSKPPTSMILYHGLFPIK